jgi:hypothetical protein
MEKFTFHYDGGHGWLEVSWTEFRVLGLNPTDFSRYSYRKHNTFFLEEDCDAPKFINVYKARNGVAPSIKEVHDGTHSPIRNYARIHTNGGA